jgi:hypothetical protein
MIRSTCGLWLFEILEPLYFVWGEIMKWFIAALVLSLGGMSSAWSSSLVLFEDNGATDPIVRKSFETAGAIIVANHLSDAYTHFDLLTGDQANQERLFKQLETRDHQGQPFDLMILTHGNVGKLYLSKGFIAENAIRAQHRYAHLRLVYMMGCYSASLVEAWKSVGAKLAIGHRDVNSLPPFFFPRLIRLLSEGNGALDSITQAQAFSQIAGETLSRYIENDQLLNSLGAEKSAPVFTGEDLRIWKRESAIPFPSGPSGSDEDFEPYLDRVRLMKADGRRSHESFSSARWIDGDAIRLFAETILQAGPKNSDQGARKSFAQNETFASHSEDTQRAEAGSSSNPLLNLELQLLKKWVPAATVRTEALANPQVVFDQIKDLLWENLGDLFPAWTDSFTLSRSRSRDDDIDPLAGNFPVLKGLLYGNSSQSAQSLYGAGKALVLDILEHLRGIYLERVGQNLQAEISFTSPLTLVLAERSKVQRMQLYEIDLPKKIQLSFSLSDSILSITTNAEDESSVRLQLKVPALPDTVVLRNFHLSLMDGTFSAEAGLIGNHITATAKGSLLGEPIHPDWAANFWRLIKYLSRPPEIYWSLFR